jgi:hypothetical protein
MSRAEWGEELRRLADAGIVSREYPAEVASLPAHLDPVAPQPGIELSFSWPLDEASRLDDRDQLVAAVAAKIEQGLQALGTADAAERCLGV